MTRQHHWACRYGCGITGENGTPHEAVFRARAHEYNCPDRSDSEDKPTYEEWLSYQVANAADLRRELDALRSSARDIALRMRRAMSFPTRLFSGSARNRKAIDAERLVMVKETIAVYVRAGELGLAPGWDQPDFSPTIGELEIQ